VEFIIENWYYFVIGLVVVIALIIILSKKPTPKKDVEVVKESPKEAQVVEPVETVEKKVEVVQEPVVVKKEDPKPEVLKVDAPIVEETKVAEAGATEETKPVTEEKKKTVVKKPKYHVSQNKDENTANYKKWRVRKEGSDKTIKFFDTQKEAIAFAEDLANAAGSSVVIHKVDGSIRKQDYTKQ